MQIVGIFLVRNESDVLEVNLRHHLSTLIDRAVVVDNGSTDGSLDVISHLARDLPVSWTSDPGPYRQSEIFTELAREVGKEGADWVVPIDADEFWCGTAGNPREELETSPMGVLQVPFLQFAQSRDVVESSPSGLLTITMRPRSPVPPEEALALIEADSIGNIEARPPPKCISRPTPGILIDFGNHGVLGSSTGPAASINIECFHAPLRSKAQLAQKALAAKRLDGGGFGPEAAFHLRRWDRISAEPGWLDKEWEANSYQDGALLVGGRRRPLETDTRLREAVSALVRAGGIRV